MKLFLLLCAIASVLFSAVSAEPTQNVQTFDTTTTMGTPWQNPPTRYRWADFVPGSGPNDFQPIPFRYGFRLVGAFKAAITPAERTANNFPATYVTPAAAWYKLCPNPPRFGSDDYQLTIYAYKGPVICGGLASQTVANNLIQLWDNNGQITSVLPTLSTFDPLAQTISLTFNLAQVRAAAKDRTVYLRVQMNQGTVGEFYDIRFVRGNSPLWVPSSCTYPSYASSVFSPCLKSTTSLFVCSDGVFNPAVEECDLGIATKGCTAECVCNLPYQSDKAGGCTACGNGVLEKPENEVCDFGLDPNCATTCQGCVTNYVFNSKMMCTLCGNSINEPGEQCDSALSRFCMKDTCTCMARYVSDGRGGCTLCGNGVMDAGEHCDGASCSADCTSCAAGFVSRPRVGTQSRMCTLCGNGKVDAGEVCDSTDYNCNDDCMSCEEFHSADKDGKCSRCGNGLLDFGEKCDTVHPGCSAGCMSCVAGMVPSKNYLGECTSCGNGVADVDELCDTALDAQCASDCNSCLHPYTSFGRRCVLCGNGMLDDGEICDRTQPGCSPDCKTCEEGYLASKDSAGTCTALCPTCCAGLPSEIETASSSTLSASLTFLVSALIIKLSF